jgi:hypothetical protein
VLKLSKKLDKKAQMSTGLFVETNWASKKRAGASSSLLCMAHLKYQLQRQLYGTRAAHLVERV